MISLVKLNEIVLGTNIQDKMIKKIETNRVNMELGKNAKRL